MKTRTKVITTLVCMILVLLSMVVGVWAAFSNSLSISNSTITFYARNLQAALNGMVTNNNTNKDENANTTFHSNLIDEVPWELGAITFKGTDEPIVIRLSVCNNSDLTRIGVSGISTPTISNPNSISFEYRQGWGILPSGTNWDSVDLATNYDEEDWTSEPQTSAGANITLNNASENRFIEKCTKVEGVNTVEYYYILDIIITLKQERVSISQSIDFSINLTSIT